MRGSGVRIPLAAPCHPSIVHSVFFGPDTITGEYGFLLGLPRTASLKVEAAARVWMLKRDSFAEMEGAQPDLVIALMRDIVRLQAERLAFATRQAATRQAATRQAATRPAAALG